MLKVFDYSLRLQNHLCLSYQPQLKYLRNKQVEVPEIHIYRRVEKGNSLKARTSCLQFTWRNVGSPANMGKPVK